MSFTVRHSEPADIEAIRAIYSQPSNVAATLQLPFPSSELWQSRLGKLHEGFYSLVVCAGPEVVGQVGVEVFQSPRRKHVANIGLAVHDGCRRKGAASSLVVAALDLCHNWLNVRRVELETYTDNLSANALFKKHGFVTEGTCSAYAFRAGRYVDVHLMAHVAGV